jgi:hypothetical protein
MCHELWPGTVFKNPDDWRQLCKRYLLNEQTIEQSDVPGELAL